MIRVFACPGLTVLFCAALLAQTPASLQRFDVADVHARAKTRIRNAVVSTAPFQNGLYRIGNATMVDLIRLAWKFDADKILGGPNWLELDRYDVIAKAPADTNPETQRLMLQELLRDRFKLVLHRDTKPVAAWALTALKKPLLKEAARSGETGCKPRLAGFETEYSCRNMTMAAFAAGLRSMVDSRLNSPVADRTGIAGAWNFEVKWTTPAAADRISMAQALDRQLGLKLEEVPVPTQVLVVDSVERSPSPNPRGVVEALGNLAVPTRFDAADVKLVSPGAAPPRRTGFQLLPGGRFAAEDVPMSLVIAGAFTDNLIDQIIGVPDWASSVRVSITAKIPAEYPWGQTMDREITGSMLRALLVERFGLAWHTEQRPASAHSLVAVKPKMKRPADPNGRIFCRTLPPSPYSDPSQQVLRCQNTTMTMFAERLRGMAPGVDQVEDDTGLVGPWDFSLSFDPAAQAGSFGPGGRAGAGQDAQAAEPAGGYTVLEAIEKQLGLRLEARKRMLPVTVIDRLNQNPTEN